MNNKVLRLSILVGLICFLISCQLLSNSKTTAPGSVVATEPVLFYDDFSKDQNNWAMGEFTGDYADILYQIESGIYKWTVKSHQIANERTWPELDAMGDFVVTVDARQTSSNVDECDYGIIYRDPTDKSLLSFTLSNQQFSVYSYSVQDEWIEIIPWTDSSAINPGEFNHMKVTRSDDTFTLYNNDQELVSFEYSQIAEGQLGLNADVFPADVTCVFEFDNFQVTKP